VSRDCLLPNGCDPNSEKTCERVGDPRWNQKGLSPGGHSPFPKLLVVDEADHHSSTSCKPDTRGKSSGKGRREKSRR